MSNTPLPQAHHIERTADGCIIAYDEKLSPANRAILGRQLAQLDGVDRIHSGNQRIRVVCKPRHNQKQVLRRVDELVIARFTAVSVVAVTKTRHGAWSFTLRLHVPISAYWATHNLYPQGLIVGIHLGEDGLEALEAAHMGACAEEAATHIAQQLGVWPIEPKA